MPTVKAAEQIIRMSAGLATQWTSANPKLLKGTPGYEVDTGKIKIGDGIRTWTQLPYAIDERIKQEYVDMLLQMNQAYGAAVLTEDGTVPLELLPPKATSSIKFVADIKARNNIPMEKRHNLIVVLDASGDIVEIEDAMLHTFENVYSRAADGLDDGGAVVLDFGTVLGVTEEDFEGRQQGDITVKKGAAVYTWNGTNNNGTWLKISEFESMDIDFDVYLKVLTATIDLISDGAEYIKFTQVERTKLEITMREDYINRFKGLSPQKLKELGIGVS